MASTTPASMISADNLVLHSDLQALPLPALVMWDWDESIADTTEVFKATSNEVFSQADVRRADGTAAINSEGQTIFEYYQHLVDTKQMGGTTVSGLIRTWYQDTGIENWPEGAEALFTQYENKLKENYPDFIDNASIRLINGAKNCLEKLAASGAKLVILSNGPEGFLRNVMVPGMLGEALAKKIKVIGTRFNETGKPELDTLKRGLEELQNEEGFVSPSTDQAKTIIYHIGDSPLHDLQLVRNARNAGISMKGVLIDRLHRAGAEITEHFDAHHKKYADGSDQIADYMREFHVAPNYGAINKLIDRALGKAGRNDPSAIVSA